MPPKRSFLACSKCKMPAPPSGWCSNGYCKSCANEYVKVWRRNNVERHRATRRASWDKHKQKHHGKQREYWRNLRMRVIAEYGSKCECCGETQWEFLAIDHKFNDGAQHRRQIAGNGGGSNLYCWLRKNGFPKDRFRLLCHNCNLARGLYGKCPHEVAREQKAVASW